MRAGFEQLARMTALLLPERGVGEQEALERARALVLAVHGHIEAWLCCGGGDPAPFRAGAVRAVRAIGGAPPDSGSPGS